MNSTAMHRFSNSVCRKWLYRALLTALWIGGMGLVVVAALASPFNIVAGLVLVVGGFLAATATVALAEEAAAR